MPGNLIQATKKAGVVGSGGAGFPTHVKLDSKVEYVIVNGAECEPLLQVDQQLMEKYPKVLLNALKEVVKEVGAATGIIALKSKYKKAIKLLKNMTACHKNIEVFELGNFYPAGDEQVLVYEITGRIVNEGGIPLNVGTVVINVETLLNVSNALKGQPVTEKYVTVAGWVKDPSTFKVPVGTEFGLLIDRAGGALGENFSIIDGGPMMGKITDDLNQPVIKTTKGIVVLPADHTLVLKKKQKIQTGIKLAKSVCCQCRLCTDMCPRYLLGHSIEPHKIMRTVANSVNDAESLTQAFLCSECGLCEAYACIMDLSPKKVNQMLKEIFKNNNIKNPHNKKPEKVYDERSFRYVPTDRLTARLGLPEFDIKSPLIEEEIKPDKVVLPLSQHFGAPAKPVVRTGDLVRKGDLLADIPEGVLGARIHASISGEVRVCEDSILIKSVGEAI